MPVLSGHMGLVATVLDRAVLRPRYYSVAEQQQNSHLLTLWPMFFPLREAEARKFQGADSPSPRSPVGQPGLNHEPNCNKHL